LPLAVFEDPQWIVVWGAIAFTLGLLVGSFLNVVIYRLPRGESVIHPGSHCPHCQAAIRPWENVPVLSYLWLRGRCRQCSVRISARYPAIEFLTGCVFLALALRFGFQAETPLFLVFAALLITAAWIDLDYQIIPDGLSLGGLAVGLVLMPLARMGEGVDFSDAVFFSGVGALLGGGLLWSVGFIHARLSSAMGRRFEHWPGEGEALPRPGSLDYWTWFPGLGFGDVKLMAMIGAFVGPLGVLETIILSSLVGVLVGVVWMLKKGPTVPFGFAPSLAVGALLSALLPLGIMALFP
jgi:leader peptidase (prepilin peptidase)/N-methyltransferase